MSIITVTLNPAIDQTINLKQLVVGEVQRAESVHYTAGGKGVMVASCLADWHDDSIVVAGLLGQDNAAIFEALFQQKNIHNEFTYVAGTNRTNIKIVDEKATTDINLPGIASTQETLEKVCQCLDDQYEIAILSGSLAPNCNDNSYVRMLEILSDYPTKTIVDASGQALIATLNSAIKPYCVKPNALELSDWVGRSLTNLDDIITEAKKLQSSGIPLVVISMGGDGALFIDDQAVLLASLTAPEVLTTVGAGDAMVAGIASALRENSDLERIARLSTAFAIAKLGFIGPNLPEKSMVEGFASQVVIKRMEG